MGIPSAPNTMCPNARSGSFAFGSVSFWSRADSQPPARLSYAGIIVCVPQRSCYNLFLFRREVSDCTQHVLQFLALHVRSIMVLLSFIQRRQTNPGEPCCQARVRLHVSM